MVPHRLLRNCGMWYHTDYQGIVVCGTAQIVGEFWYVVLHRLSGKFGMWYHIDGQEIVVCGTTQIVRELWYVVTHRLSGVWWWEFKTIF